MHYRNSVRVIESGTVYAEMECDSKDVLYVVHHD